MDAAPTMFDVQQVEVLRGPQGTKFGSSALAGFINVKTNEESQETEAKIEATVGSRNTKALGVAVGGTLIEDELTARANLKFLVNDDLNFDLKVLHLNIDNGYDAFNFDNDFTTISDDPGHDRLKSNAVVLTANYNFNHAVNMKATMTKTDTTSVYGYDEDWTFEAYDVPNFAYVAFDNYIRKRKNNSLDVRFMSAEQGCIFNGYTDWVAGIHHISQNERLDRKYVSIYGGSDGYYDYNTINSSVYG